MEVANTGQKAEPEELALADIYLRTISTRLQLKPREEMNNGEYP